MVESLGPQRQYDVTKPLSLACPSEADIIRTRELEKFLVDSGLYESREEAARREEVLGHIGLHSGAHISWSLSVSLSIHVY